jgi:hypothetical protein
MAKRQPDAAVPTAASQSAPVQQQTADPAGYPGDEAVLDEMDETDLARLVRLASLAEARRKAGTAGLTAEDKELVRVYNRSRRRFDHEPYQAAPGSFCTVPRWLAKQWLRDYPGDFVAGDDALKSVDASAAALQEANLKIQKLEAELASAKTSK